MDIGSLTGQIALEDQVSGVLSTVSNNIRNFADRAQGSFGAMAVGVGVVTAAVTGAAISIVSLGQKGSVILGVEESFNRLAITAGSTGEELLGGLNEGVKGTIDSMVLMQATTRLLSSGVKLNAEDMKLMGATAREMGKATGTDAAAGLNQLSMAMLTGNQRALKRFGIQIDLVKAETDFAAKIGTTRDQLSQAGKLEAARIAMLDGMRTKLGALGISELSFKERIQQSSVAVGNWFDSLAKGVAGSSAVNGAFDAIRDSLVATFGGTSQTLLQTMLSWVDSFANSVAKWGPVIIEWMGRVRDRIVSVWEWLKDLNERYQITNTIVSVAKQAWGLLESAFYLVKDAVAAVINAWKTMPDWLQRITKSALEATLVVSAYSVAIGAVSTPMRSLVQTLDLGINILGNFTGAIFNMMHIPWGKWVGDATKAYQMLTAATIGSTVATNAGTVANNFWSGSSLVMGARMAVTTVATYAASIANTAAASTTGLWSTAVAYLGGTKLILGARLALATSLTTAATVAETAATAATIAFGTAVNILTFAINKLLLPLAAFYAGLKLGTWLEKNTQWAKDMADGFHTLGGILVTFNYTQAKASTEAYRAAQAYLEQKDAVDALARSQAEAAAQEERRRKDSLTGQDTATAIHQLRTDFLSLSKAQQESVTTMDRVGEAASRLRAQGGRLHPELKTLADRYDEAQKKGTVLGGGFIDLTSKGEALQKKINELYESLRDGDDATKAIAGAVGRLSDEQLTHLSVLQRVVPEIQKLAAANETLTPKMLTALDTHTRLRIERNKSAIGVLHLAGVTQQSIDAYIREGKTLEEIAQGYSRNSKQIRITAEDINSLLAVRTQLAAVEQAALARAKEESERAKEPFRQITAFREEAAEHAKQLSMSTADYQIAQIQKWADEVLNTSRATGAARVKLEEQVTAAVDRQTTAIITDAQLVRSTSIVELESIRKKAEATYAAMTKVSGSHSAAAIRDQAAIARAAAIAAKGMDVDSSALANASKSNLQAIATTARNTYIYATTNSDQFHKTAIDHFKRLAEEAERAAKGIKADWKDVASEILTAFGDMFEGINSRIGQAIHIFARGMETMVNTAVSGGARIAAGLGAAAGALASLLGENPGGIGSAAVGGLSGAAAGVGIGFMLGGPAGAAVGAAIGGITGALFGWMGASKRAREEAARQRKELAELAAQTLRLRTEYIDAAGGLETLTQRAFTAGTTLTALFDAKNPEAYRKAVDDLNNALKFQDDAMKLLDDTAAKYGLTLAEMGPKYAQGKLNEQFQTLYQDQEVLRAGGVAYDLILQKQAESYQTLIDQVIETGATIPLEMKPAIQRMIELGLITDASGEKLTDIGKLTFAETLDSKFQTLIKSIEKLVDAITRGLSGALADIPQPAAPWAHWGDPPGLPNYKKDEWDEPQTQQPAYHSQGGVVVPMTPRGTDTVPAMLTPGERVLTVAERKAYESGGNMTIQLVLSNGKVIAREVVPWIPGELRRLGVAQ